MPPGTPLNSFVLPYRIRVDNFTSSTGDDAPALHLLTHTHSDHIVGLSAQSFGYKIICSPDAKEMLLRHEVYGERELHDQEFRAQKMRTFAHLKVDPILGSDGLLTYSGSRDLLETIPLHTPTKYELSEGETVTITSFDANHCPGAVMYLIEGAQGAVLHTGDFRAEPWFLENITRNPFLQPYLYRPNRSTSSITKPLKAIYLDTACVLSKLSLPTKDRATSGLTELMKLFPDSVYFFINTWTWGYEDILKAISLEFSAKIHVDRYKYSIYNHTSDPFLRSIVTQDPSSTRFHACERFHRCDYVAVDSEPWQSQYNTTSYLGKRVVYINPVNMGTKSWELYITETKNRMAQGEEINNLLVPLSRHSPLDELRDFVKLFRPHRVIPNTLDPHLRGFDWSAIDQMFADCIHPEANTADIPTVELNLSGLAAAVKEDVLMQNLVGEGATAAAERWADKYHLRKKLDILTENLDGETYNHMARIFGLPRRVVHVSLPKNAVPSPPQRKGKGKERAVDSEDESENGWSDDERGKTAHRLFSHFLGLDGTNEHTWWVSSSPVQSQENVEQASILGPVREEKRKDSTPTPIKDNQPGPSIPWAARLTPQSSPLRFRKRSAQQISPQATPCKSRIRLGDVAFPQTPTHRPIKSIGPSGTNGLSLASPIVLSSSPIGPSMLFAMPSKPAAIHDRDIESTEKKSRPVKCSEPGKVPDLKAVSKTRVQPQANRDTPKAHDISIVKPLSLKKQGQANRGLNLSVTKRVSSNKQTNSTSNPQPPTPSSSRLPPSSPIYIPSSPLAEVINNVVRNRDTTPDPVEDLYTAEPTHAPTKYGKLNSMSTPFDENATNPHHHNTTALGKRSSRDSLPDAIATPTKFLRRATSSLKSEHNTPRNSGTPPASRRSQLRTQRLLIAERLAEARPDLVDPSYFAKRTRLLARQAGSPRIQHRLRVKFNVKTSPCAPPQAEAVKDLRDLSFETVDDDDGGMDWNRSKQLADALRADALSGRRLVLPPLLCAESQDD